MEMTLTVALAVIKAEAPGVFDAVAGASLEGFGLLRRHGHRVCYHASSVNQLEVCGLTPCLGT